MYGSFQTPYYPPPMWPWIPPEPPNRRGRSASKEWKKALRFYKSMDKKKETKKKEEPKKGPLSNYNTVETWLTLTFLSPFIIMMYSYGLVVGVKALLQTLKTMQ